MNSTREALEKYQRLRALLATGWPIPADLRLWWLNGMRDAEATGCTLETALGLTLKQGARYRGPALCRRSAMERDLIHVADLIGPRDSATADKIARALAGEAGHISNLALDYLFRARRIHDGQIPSSKNAIYMIIQGGTRAALYGLTS